MSTAALLPTGSWTLALGALGVFSALLIAVSFARAPHIRRHVAAELAGAPRAASRIRLADLGTQASELADRALARNGRRRALEDALERAGMDVKAGEYLALAVAGIAGGAFVGFVLAGAVFAVLFGVATGLAFRGFLAWRTAKRRGRFDDQLGDALQLLTGSLRSGHSLPQAIDALVRESEEPLKDEFRRVLFETRLGHPVTESLRAAARRVGNVDFEWVVQAIEIQQSVGGDLASLLDNVISTIRDRNRVRRQVQTLTAEGRLSGIILFALPILMFLFISVVNRTYLEELTGTLAGNVMLGSAILLLSGGGLWLRRVVRPIF